MKEFNQSNHFSSKIKSKNYQKFNTYDDELKFTITGNMSLKPIILNCEGENYWIKEAEYEYFKTKNIDLSKIVDIQYTEGLVGPYNNSNSVISKAVDAYEVRIKYNITKDKVNYYVSI